MLELRYGQQHVDCKSMLRDPLTRHLVYLLTARQAIDWQVVETHCPT